MAIHIMPAFLLFFHPILTKKVEKKIRLFLLFHFYNVHIIWVKHKRGHLFKAALIFIRCTARFKSNATFFQMTFKASRSGAVMNFATCNQFNC